MSMSYDTKSCAIHRGVIVCIAEHERSHRERRDMLCDSIQLSNSNLDQGKGKRKEKKERKMRDRSV